MARPRSNRATSRRPRWILVLLSLLCVTLIGLYVYPLRRFLECYFLSSSVCTPFKDWLPPVPARIYTDDEIAANVLFRDILSSPLVQSENPKIAFMFLTPGSLPFEKLWEKFFLGHEDRFTIYVHASKENPVHESPLFIGRDIHSKKVAWEKIAVVDAERRLLARALQDTDNQHFVLLSDSFEDPGPHGAGRYSEHMLPEIERRDFRKGAQWFSVKRQHAVLILADNLYYETFKFYCKPGMEGHNCYPDEHYLPTFFHMVDPFGIANWSITHVHWSEGKWHPKARDVTFELLKNISSIEENIHVTSDQKKIVWRRACLWNGMKRPCYLFARKFHPEALDVLLHLFLNFAAI